MKHRILPSIATILFLLLFLFAADASAQIVNPGGEQNPTIVKQYKEGFVEVFGARPFGPRDLKMVQRQMVWDAEHERFGKIEEAAFTLDSLLRYQEVGMGFPVQYSRKDGRRFVAFPEARYSKFHYVDPAVAKLFPGKISRDYFLDSVQKGFCVPDLEPQFPGFVIAQNQQNCANE